MVPDIAQKDGVVVFLERTMLNRNRPAWRPPRVKMGTRASSEPGPPPPAIVPTRGFVMDPVQVHCHTLKEQGNPLADRFGPPRVKLF